MVTVEYRGEAVKQLFRKENHIDDVRDDLKNDSSRYYQT